MRTLCLALFLAGLAHAQPVVGVGNAAQGNATNDAGTAVANETTVTDSRTVTEDDRIGPYGQPRWSDRRRFPETRVYVAPPGSATFEFWFEPKVSSDGTPLRLRTMYELSFGLGHRLQLDLYLRLQHEGTDPVQLESERVELRYALADWGVIPGNPTLYLEWIRPTVDPQRLELKLLLGGQFSARLFWGANLFWERELWGGPQESEYGLSYSLLDTKFSLGAARARRSPEYALRPRCDRASSRAVDLLPAVAERARAVGGVSRARALMARSGVGVFQPNLVVGWRF